MYEDPTATATPAARPTPPRTERSLARRTRRAAMDRMLDLRRIFYALAKHDGVWVTVAMQDKRTGVKLG